MRDPGIRDRGGELKVGALVLVAVVVLIIALFWVSSARFGGPSLELTGVASQAGQLTSDSRVFFLGIEVGTVREVELDGRRVVVDLAIYEELTLPSDTRGVIKPAGFLGSQMVELIAGTGGGALASGDTIPLGRQSDLQSLASDLGSETTEVLDRVQAALSDQTIDGIQGSTQSFAAAMQELQSLIEGERAALHAMIDGLQRTSGRLADVTGGPELDRAVANLDSLSARLAASSATFERTSASLAQITARLERGEGSLGKMLTDDRLYEEMTETMGTLRNASEELALLMQDLRDRPERYLRDVSISVF